MTEETATGTDGFDPAPGADTFVASILACVAQPVWMVDQDGLIRFANPAAVAALGYDDLPELRGRPSHQTIHYKRRDGSPFPADECPMLLPRTTGKTIHRTDDWFVRRDGSMFPVEYWSAPIGLPRGRGAVVAFTDLGERRQAEDVLRERDAILSALGQPVYVATPDGVITYANPAAVIALGFDDVGELTGPERALAGPLQTPGRVAVPDRGVPGCPVPGDRGTCSRRGGLVGPQGRFHGSGYLHGGAVRGAGRIWHRR